MNSIEVQRIIQTSNKKYGIKGNKQKRTKCMSHQVRLYFLGTVTFVFFPGVFLVRTNDILFQK